MKRVLLNMAAGALGALVIWLIAEPIPWLTMDLPPGAPINYTAQLVLGALVGAGIGVGLGAAEGIYRGSSVQLTRNVAMGAATGLAGGTIGIYFGQAIFGPLYSFGHGLEHTSLAASFAVQLVARAVGWALMGLFMGAAQGLLTASSQKVRNGLIGGLAGGAIGGFLFQMLWEVVRVPAFSRAIGFTTVGAAIGLGIATADALLKQAWVRVMLGRNEGNEYILTKDLSVIGRDELADIGLFGDRSVGLQHAFIRRTPLGYVLQDAGNSTGTKVNGVPISERPLSDGDVIDIGSFRLEFHEKAGRVPVARPVDVSRPAPSPAAPPGVCPYCGSVPDPVTGACLCSVPAAGQLSASPPPAGVSPATAAVAAPIRSGIRLRCVAGPCAGQSFPIPGALARIGREPGQDIVVSDPTVSRHHAIIREEGGRLTITDEGSANGTFVNGTRVTSSALAPGDEVRLGTSVFRVEAS